MRDFFALFMKSKTLFFLSIISLGSVGIFSASGYSQQRPSASSPVPHVFQSLSPDRGTPGSSAISLTIYGTGFLSGTSTVSFVVPGSTSCTGQVNNVRVLSAREITATVPSICLQKAATAWVSVKNGSVYSNVVFFPISSQTNLNFAATRQGPISVAQEPVAIALADFNKDGKLDLAVASATVLHQLDGGTVSILLGNGDGTFQPPTAYVTAVPYGLAIGDFNGDGNLDIAGADEASLPGLQTSIFVMLGKGDGSFEVQSPIASSGHNPFSIVTADFNCDGNLDLVTANNDASGMGVTFLAGNGDGTFQSAVTYNECDPQGRGVALCQNPIQAEAGDFDNDGILDLAVLEWSQGMPAVALLRGSCPAGLSPNSVFDTGFPPDVMQLGLANFSGHTNGTLDLAYMGNGSPAGGSGLLIGQGTLRGRTFTGFKAPGFKCNNCSTAAFPNAFAIGDFNADNVLDVAVATGNFPLGSQAGTAAVTALQGAGNGTFNAQTTTTNYSGNMSNGVVAGDFNNDGKLDLAVINYASGTVTVLLHQ